MKRINYFPFAHAPGFAGYGASRGASHCESQLAGHTEYGLLVVTQDARTPKTVPWSEVAEIRLGGCILWLSLLLGLGFLATAALVFYIAWNIRFFTCLSMIVIPPLLGLGVYFLIAAPRRYVEARIDSQWLRWLSPPRVRAKVHDQQLVELCKQNGIPVH